jgi:hypothetical protein
MKKLLLDSGILSDYINRRRSVYERVKCSGCRCDTHCFHRILPYSESSNGLRIEPADSDSLPRTQSVSELMNAPLA